MHTKLPAVGRWQIICMLFPALFGAMDVAMAEVTFDWVTVGNPGNPPNADIAPRTLGVVDYAYRISKYEVTNSQYIEFLNAVTLEDGFYDPSQRNSPNGGILRFGDGTGSTPFRFEVKPGYEKKPVVFVNALDIMYFVNWLELGQPTGVSQDFLASDRDGTYNLSVSGIAAGRRSGKSHFIPSQDEWYKAAAYDPTTETYFQFATSSNEVPTSVPPPGSGAPVLPNTANVFADDGLNNGINDGYPLSGSTVRSDDQLYLTDVGAYTMSSSPYGTFDQTGNVQEYTESIGPGWGLNGGSFENGGIDPAGIRFIDLDRFQDVRFYRAPDLGFRVANRSVPEPESGILWCLAALVFSTCHRRDQGKYHADK